jgi:hypothetical protein
VQASVPALTDEMDVDVAERGRERVRVSNDERTAGWVGNLELVVQDAPLDDALEQTRRMYALELCDDGSVDEARHRLSLGAPRPDDGGVGVRVGSEERVRIADAALDEGVDLVLRCARHLCTLGSKTRAIPRSGMGSHAGRCACSYRTS